MDATTNHPQPYTLGIDLGTTSIKIVIVDSAGGVVENVTVPSLANVTSIVGEDGAEQCPVAIWNALHAGLKQIDPDNQVKFPPLRASRSALLAPRSALLAPCSTLHTLLFCTLTQASLFYFTF
ncbi:hypothetical protein V1264_022157 [Littorina saxatilis]|uniref:Carbohydrate kinase FGGY N-terminal domain-containing protein n=1 Tax=Littorina saxatilis TaxID=31220 RepID=A0AAN9FWY0_9CAEN